MAKAYVRSDKRRIKYFFDLRKEVNITTNKILSFCLGEEDGTAIFCETREEFLQYINEKIDEAEERGQEHFDMTIEKTEC